MDVNGHDRTKISQKKQINVYFDFDVEENMINTVFPYIFRFKKKILFSKFVHVILKY